VVGEVDAPCPGATHHGFVADRTTLFALMGRARVVACPSLFDAAPGILFEASALGCNVVASRNCGNWQLCHPDLLAQRMDVGSFAGAITLALSRKYEDHARRYLDSRSIERLVEVLDVL
jgi:glycosyltransferase involved in cell wall biosynthesis